MAGDSSPRPLLGNPAPTIHKNEQTFGKWSKRQKENHNTATVPQLVRRSLGGVGAKAGSEVCSDAWVLPNYRQDESRMAAPLQSRKCSNLGNPFKKPGFMKFRIAVERQSGKQRQFFRSFRRRKLVSAVGLLTLSAMRLAASPN